MNNAIFEAAKCASVILRKLKVQQELLDTKRLRIDPIKLSSDLRVIVVLKQMEKLLGAYVNTANQQGILLNYDRPFGLVNMTCAHELGHHALAHDSTYDIIVEYDTNAQIQELQADAFAYSLLLPNWLLKKAIAIEGISNCELKEPYYIYQLSLRFGLSYSGMVWLLHRKRLINLIEAKSLVNIQPKSIKRSIIKKFSMNVDNHLSDIWVLTDKYRTCVVEPKIGDSIILQLPSHPTSGMRWKNTEPNISIHPVLVTPESNTFSSDSQFVGGVIIPHEIQGLEHCIGIKPHDVVLVEKREFVNADSVCQEFSVGIQTHAMENGLNVYERSRRLSV